jgi:hypothetical protein
LIFKPITVTSTGQKLLDLQVLVIYIKKSVELTPIRLWSSSPLPYLSPLLIVRRGIGIITGIQP